MCDVVFCWHKHREFMSHIHLDSSRNLVNKVYLRNDNDNDNDNDNENMFITIDFIYTRYRMQDINTLKISIKHYSFSGSIHGKGGVKPKLMDKIDLYRRPDGFLNRCFRLKSKKASNHCATGLCEGNPSVTGGFPSQRAGSAEHVSIYWPHHDHQIVSS